MSDTVVEQTYQALLSVVQTTAVTRKVLRRPPFTFLHKLLVETIGGYDVFTSAQLDFSALTSKEAKAAFLTRALAFVTFAMANAKEQCVSCLLLVSPIKVLAGVAVDDTLEFLLQLCVVCRSVDRDAKDAAAQQVLQKGDELLYKSSVSFRRGLILVQAVIRTFIRRRAGKRRASEISAQAPTSRIPMSVGTRFLKELPHGCIYDGVIRSVHNNRYTLVYDQDPEAQDDVDEIEMKIILEESQRIAMYRDRISESGRRISKRHSKRADDADISLTSLPDLSAGFAGFSAPHTAEVANLRSIKRISSGDTGAALLALKTQQPVLVRSLSQRQTKSSLDSLGSRHIRPSPSLESTWSPTSANSRQQAGPPQPLAPASSSAEAPGSSHAATSDADVVRESNQSPAAANDTDGKTWQASLRKMLDDGRQSDQSLPGAAIVNRQVDGERERHAVVRKKENAASVLAPPSTSSRTTASPSHMPTFPKLGIPGTKSLVPSASKRRLIDATADAKSKPSAPGRSTARLSDAETIVEPAVKLEASAGDVTSIARVRSNSVISLRGSIASEPPADAAFTGTYQSTDYKTQEKLAFIREVVMHIDSYMRRKRLRVIDLFRFCDADGNGSISPQEMIDTLSQMEIQLTPEQGADLVSFIDKDGNGSIDIDEFEEIVRVARRQDAQREQLKREPHAPKRGEHKAPGKFTAVVKARQRILDEFKAAQPADSECVSSAHLRAVLVGLSLPNVDDACINALVDRAIAMSLGIGRRSSGSSSNASAGVHSASTTAGAKAAEAGAPTSSSSDGGRHATVTYAHLAKALDDLEWAKKANRFLNHAWIAHFDAQMERAAREFDLL